MKKGQFIYVNDSCGEIIGYIKSVDESRGIIFIGVFSERVEEKWLPSRETYCVEIRNKYQYKCYDTYEEFCEEHFVELL